MEPKFHIHQDRPRLARPLFRSESGTSTPLLLPDAYTEPHHKFPGLDTAHSSTGVIWTTERAAEQGFTYEEPTWSNLGQGAPEVGEIEGCPSKPDTINVNVHTREYAPTAGVTELREAVANLYNKDYRQGKSSKYT